MIEAKVEQAMQLYESDLPALTASLIQAPPSDLEMKMSKTEMQEQRVLAEVTRCRHFVKVVGMTEEGTLFYADSESPSARKQMHFTRLMPGERDKMVVEAYQSLYHRKPSATIVDKIGESLRLWVNNEADRLAEERIMISTEAYWDRRRQGFESAGAGAMGADGSSPCFRMLFDGRPSDDIQVPIEEINATLLQVVFKRALKNIEENGGRLVPSDDDPMFRPDTPVIKTFMVWANQDLDTFNDLLKAVATNFFKEKPKGAFLLIGRTRNGKSSFIKMLHTLFGTRNTSEVTLAQLDDPHVNMTLLTSMMNAPDEEEEGKGQEILRAQDKFKMLATHKSLQLPVYYSQEPQHVPTNFMSYHAMNDMPQWQGAGAEACLKRSIIIMFNNDLSKMDRASGNFERETYTPAFFTNLIGIALAFSKYYSDKPLEFSQTQQMSNQAISEEVDTMSTYLNRFRKWFPGGYSTPNIVWEDYKMWCEERGVRWQSKPALSAKLRMFGTARTTMTVKAIKTQASETFSAYVTGEGAVFHRYRLVEKLGGRMVQDIMLGDQTPGRQYRPARSVIGWLDEVTEKKKSGGAALGEEAKGGR